jgi:hypothetical protein
MILEEVIAERSKTRKIAAQNNNAAKEMRDREESSPTETGRTRDKVAEITGHSSGKVYDQSKKVVQEVDKLRAEGKNEDANLLVNTLENAPSAANELVKIGLDNISQEDKSALKEKKITVNAIVKKTKKKKEKELSPDEIERIIQRDKEAAKRAEEKQQFNEKYGHLSDIEQYLFRQLQYSNGYLYVYARNDNEEEYKSFGQEALVLLRNEAKEGIDIITDFYNRINSYITTGESTELLINGDTANGKADTALEPVTDVPQQPSNESLEARESKSTLPDMTAIINYEKEAYKTKPATEETEPSKIKETTQEKIAKMKAKKEGK